MSKKQLLTESEIRRFMKLANLEPLAKNVVREGWQQQDENAPPQQMQQAPMKEAGLSGDDAAEPQGDEMPMDAGMEGGEEEGEGEMTPEKKKEIEDYLEKMLGKKVSVEFSEDDEIDIMPDEEDDEGEEDDEDEAPEGKKEEDDEEEEEELEETLSEDALVETVLARVTARLVAEAAKKPLTPAQKAMKEKAEKAKKDKKAKKPAAKESLQLKGDKLEEATSAEGGGPLLKQGKNKYDVYKGHADMTMAKGDKGGKGGHSLETVSAKAEHTVTHGGKNLATLGGNKKKV